MRVVVKQPDLESTPVGFGRCRLSHWRDKFTGKRDHGFCESRLLAACRTDWLFEAFQQNIGASRQLSIVPVSFYLFHTLSPSISLLAATPTPSLQLTPIFHSLSASAAGFTRHRHSQRPQHELRALPAGHASSSSTRDITSSDRFNTSHAKGGH